MTEQFTWIPGRLLLLSAAVGAVAGALATLLADRSGGIAIVVITMAALPWSSVALLAFAPWFLFIAVAGGLTMNLVLIGLGVQSGHRFGGIKVAVGLLGPFAWFAGFIALTRAFPHLNGGVDAGDLDYVGLTLSIAASLPFLLSVVPGRAFRVFVALSVVAIWSPALLVFGLEFVCAVYDRCL